MSEVLAEVSGKAGCITLNRPRALNALSLGMIREITSALLAWRDDPAVELVLVRGMGKEGPFGVLSAGGDIRFFHQAVLAGDPRLEDFFTEEYTLNHLIHDYPKPYVAFMDGVVMGGGMGISQGARCRIVTERTKVAMPETAIGLFPDVGGGWFLGRCPGRIGEYLALTGDAIGAAEALQARLADTLVPSAQLPDLWDRLAREGESALPAHTLAPADNALATHLRDIERFFGEPTVPAIVRALEADGGPWATHAAGLLRKRSPLMLHVTLEQLRRARGMDLAGDLRMERDIVRHCFQLRPGTAGETMEGIRALAIDKDHAPRWNPARIEDVRDEEVAKFFDSPWPMHAHPLRDLAGDAPATCRPA